MEKTVKLEQFKKLTEEELQEIQGGGLEIFRLNTWTYISKEKIKKGNNRPQSLLSTSMQKKKNKVKHRNEQYLQHKAEEERKAQEAIATEIELSGPLTVKELAEKNGPWSIWNHQKIDAFRCYG